MAYEDEQFLKQVFTAISEADVISIFFPLLRRALVVDARNFAHIPPMIKVMPQVGSMEERIAGIEAERSELGKVRAILGIPWLKSVRTLEDQGVLDSLSERLVQAGMSPEATMPALRNAVEQLWKIERMAFMGLIKGEGYRTI